MKVNGMRTFLKVFKVQVLLNKATILLCLYSSRPTYLELRWPLIHLEKGIEAEQFVELHTLDSSLIEATGFLFTCCQELYYLLSMYKLIKASFF